MLDPHDPSCAVNRPLKKGKTFKLPKASKPSTPAARSDGDQEKRLRLQVVRMEQR
jgi:hypothetical protein